MSQSSIAEKKKPAKTLQRCECGYRMMTEDGEFIYLRVRKIRRSTETSLGEVECPKCKRWHLLE